MGRAEFGRPPTDPERVMVLAGQEVRLLDDAPENIVGMCARALASGEDPAEAIMGILLMGFLAMVIHPADLAKAAAVLEAKVLDDREFAGMLRWVVDQYGPPDEPGPPSGKRQLPVKTPEQIQQQLRDDARHTALLAPFIQPSQE